jgi:hypothetical protein
MTTKFSKRHYQAIAEMLAREVAPVISTPDFGHVVNEFVVLFKGDNAKFSEQKFLNCITKNRGCGASWAKKAS